MGVWYCCIASKSWGVVRQHYGDNHDGDAKPNKPPHPESGSPEAQTHFETSGDQGDNGKAYGKELVQQRLAATEVGEENARVSRRSYERRG